ncbi:5-methyltetrahydropteroyltriglutamate--homocysteine S-methyltransferase [Phytohabitans sp. ZYX-F-186]|uniref:5-methyltetrahydropteroyltriglutamate--homocysteine S-methyltransferase n=1 Tax=Phytohabitans maris TaxID=3071409 RepID=A0ABU0ZEH8_9ACTN|nr:5-methyltetrahydropteroyltriglutamate--homocysteine S-methyltransferase [Phytohabitans sp. ZYX-F-186]MDQ7905363.1 5-methyltetrahydropteroyltriglutamate--homocysteine S-methyltransferase [Phytohabitans sp. ZYX-F-186]
MLTHSTILGYPRIGPRRELKRALEAYWDGRLDRDGLDRVGADLRAGTWRRLAALGLRALPSNTFSEYDHVLDTAVLLDAVPERYRAAADPYFAMARGADGLPPLRMTKWFDTNYHYLVPEIGARTPLRLAGDKPIREVREARALGHETRPVLVGPVTFLLLSEPAAGDPPPLTRLDDALTAYADLLAALAAEGVEWVQLDEPALVTGAGVAQARRAYEWLGALSDRPKLLVASYFGEPGEALPALAATGIEAIGVDLVRGGPVDPAALGGKTLVAGVVSGRDVWRTDLGAALYELSRYPGVVVSTSCSLLHVPYDLDAETGLDPALRERLAFADQKVAEVVALADRLARGARGRAPSPRPAGRPAESTLEGRAPYPERSVQVGLPPLPVTTIGSFPQTGELRAARAALAAGTLDQRGYERLIEAEIERVIRLQERLGVDVLVHGEPERNDMVQYFAEHLDGFATTRHGWVQSYGSRCTRPPIIHGDVRRTAPITVRWTRFAQSLTERPVKGMLTGPVTIVAWSFVRRDIPLREVVVQVAEAVRAEVRDLAAAGTSIIQVDEPALRELLPLRRERQDEYLQWAVAAYRHATSSAGDHTQIHTHLCYSNASEVIAAIDGLDADVTTIESARSGGRILGELDGFGRGLGPGVYDIHSPRVPSAEEVGDLLDAVLKVVPVERVWVNPDCGLKTRTYPQVEAALANLVTAARERRPSP